MSNLKTYESHKIVHAEPMSFEDYGLFRIENPFFRSSIIDVADDVNEGYHIVYDMGSGDEYHSWCPKSKFEAGNSLTSSHEIEFFGFTQLPPHLQVVSKPVGKLAQLMDANLPNCDQKKIGMQKLIEAKDAFVRASI